jgi:hypothetical protein
MYLGHYFEGINPLLGLLKRVCDEEVVEDRSRLDLPDVEPQVSNIL